MPTKQKAKAKISAAVMTCGAVEERWSTAVQVLSGTVSVNGFGIFRDHTAVRSKLMVARSNIAEAIKALDTVDWPTDAEYDQF